MIGDEVGMSARKRLQAQDAARVSKDLDAPIKPGEFQDAISPEAAEKLFKAIVLETFKDACAELPEPLPDRMPRGWKPSVRSKEAHIRDAWEKYKQGHKNRRLETMYDRDNARAWLLKAGADFDRICQFAGWEPGYIRRGANKLAALGWPSRESFAEVMAA